MGSGQAAPSLSLAASLTLACRPYAAVWKLQKDLQAQLSFAAWSMSGFSLPMTLTSAMISALY
jgi:hypothetical protein